MDVWERLKMCFIGRSCGNGYSMALVPGDTPMLLCLHRLQHRRSILYAGKNPCPFKRLTYVSSLPLSMLPLLAISLPTTPSLSTLRPLSSLQILRSKTHGQQLHPSSAQSSLISPQIPKPARRLHRTLPSSRSNKKSRFIPRSCSDGSRKSNPDLRSKTGNEHTSSSVFITNLSSLSYIKIGVSGDANSRILRWTSASPLIETLNPLLKVDVVSPSVAEAVRSWTEPSASMLGKRGETYNCRHFPQGLAIEPQYQRLRPPPEEKEGDEPGGLISVATAMALSFLCPSL